MNNKLKHKAINRKCHLKRFYNLTTVQYNKLLLLQNGVCAICGRPPKTRKLHVDHDHGLSKRIRGILCFRCNLFLVGKNTKETAKKVLAYLESDFDGRTL